jgi:seryl-tRNA synthetase
MLDVHTTEHGYTKLCRRLSSTATRFSERINCRNFEDELFHLKDERGFALIPTA